MRLIIILLLLLSMNNMQAGTIDPKVPDQKYVEYGKKHECVLPIVGVYGDKLNSQFKASCVIIDEYHILTAAHIVADSITQHILYNGKAYPCAIIAINSKYKHDNMGRHDIALARLQRPIRIDFYPELYKDRDEVGKVCSLAGYGITGNFITGYKQGKFDNKKRAGSNIIDEVEKNILTYSIHKNSKTELEFLITPGDSGGGLFIDQKLAGIHSYVYATDGKSDSDYGDVGCSTRISDYIQWISDTKKILEETISKEN